MIREKEETKHRIWRKYMYLIAGLGNPGREYENTRHNAGFASIDRLAEKNHISIDMKKFQALCGTGYIGGQKVLLLKPQTYMNLSGESLRAACDFFKIDPEQELIVIYDDISLAPGQLRHPGKGKRRRTQRDQKHHLAPWHAGVFAGEGGCRREAAGLGSGRLRAWPFLKGRAAGDAGIV